MTQSLMILGTASGVGKSIVSTGLCRIFRQRGWNVAPFKSQNMSSKGYRLEDGREMAKAQVIAAWACGVEPVAEMNPILLKPVDGVTEVIVSGENFGRMDRHEYQIFKREKAWPVIMAAYRQLVERHDVIVLEGAGSPVELNMKDDDVANINMAKNAKSPVLLVVDIERGGAFAMVKGTLALLDDEERPLVKGIIINKCRGRMELFDEVGQTMESMTGLPVVGMVPYLDIDIEDEDSLCDVRKGPKAEMPDLPEKKRTLWLNAQFDSLAESLAKHLDMVRICDIMERGI